MRVEHNVALQFGGTNERDNLSGICERCARTKDKIEAGIAAKLGKRNRPKFKGWEDKGQER